MGWKTGLPHCWPYDNSRRLRSHCPSHNGLLSKGEGPGSPCANLPAQQPFRFDHLRSSPIKDTSGDGGSNHQPSLHQPLRGQDHNRCWRDLRPPLPQFPSHSLDCGFRSNRSSLLMASLMSSRSDRSDRSWHSQQGRWHWEDGAHMKINLPVFKDQDAKDTVIYQSWRWNLIVYHCVGCRDHTLLPYAIWSLQGYPGELVQSSGTDITLDDVGWSWMNTIIMWKHCTHWIRSYSNYGWQTKKLYWTGVSISQDISRFWPLPFPTAFPNWVAELKRGHFYGRLPKWLKAVVPYLKMGLQVRTYSDYLRAAQEAKREDSMELPWGPKPMTTSFFPLRKPKGNQSILK